MAETPSHDNPQQHIYTDFASLVAQDDAAIDLAHAALLIAKLAYPDLDICHHQAQLDALARRVRGILGLSTAQPTPHNAPLELDPEDLLQALNQVLFEEEHFTGNVGDYNNPDNSYLNRVLEEHSGIPITLSLLYMEVARRAGLRLEGVGLPFHFVIRCQLGEETMYIDAFHQGQLLSQHECLEMVRRIAHRPLKLNRHWFKPVSSKQLLGRILNNLKRIYLDRDAYESGLAIYNLILLLQPQSAPDRRARGLLHLHLKHYGRALHDLNAYREMAPEAEDRYEILNYIKIIRQTIAMLN
ncbi:SirB1 family protein [Ktedonospora formicarum]|uniref:Protein SirB1 N-terminal domain-containing protein n=1 Tax=Ktedonospora formicarum TaxID=2778364 RepID=A0A8J3MRD6_9CHLR|nr:transglutaminase-like domain-containing protein [Ktedonospora formicarum]GHO44935.1 hypothetical protein KSX_30980 [Ktedonospora formicarum]